ncbi:hypothetical protein [Cryptosporangium aurantiacum]|uniref:Uncharacterized protein n=1 Tax=Cryptosporangium aurantiacum TaxID=134849 RepID=A0A1M7TZA7_9ACTN|nr:hypothetical protein [Cryptosporangium aurantiacum]SHN76003.1 hypothetical protein SAMN05443668_107433 [Cryptosporangium aurantiacum]
MPTVSPPEAPWTVRVAVRACRAAMVGVLVQWAAFLLWVASDLLSDPSGSGSWVTLLLLTVVAAVTITPVVVPWAGVYAASGRPLGRTVLWVFGPLAILVDAALCVTDLILLTENNLSIGARIYPAAGVPGALLVLATLPVALAAWATPSARRYLAAFRRPEHAHRGRRAVTAAVVLLGVGTGLGGVAVALLVHARSAVVFPEWAFPREDPAAYLAVGAGLAAVTVLAEVVFLAGLVTTRRTRSRWFRSLTFGVGMATLALVPPGVYAIGLGVDVAAGELAGDTTRFAGTAGLVSYVSGGVLHALVVLLLALPSVSTWVARTAAAREAPQPAAGPEAETETDTDADDPEPVPSAG